MEINREMLRQLDKVDEEQLRRAAYAIAKAMGANPLQAQMAARNIDAFKKRAASMSDEELGEVSRSIPDDKAEEIARMLKINKGKGD